MKITKEKLKQIIAEELNEMERVPVPRDDPFGRGQTEEIKSHLRALKKIFDEVGLKYVPDEMKRGLSKIRTALDEIPGLKANLEEIMREEESSEGVGPGYIVTHNKDAYYGSTNRLTVGYTNSSNFKLKDNQMFFATHEEAEEAKKKLRAEDEAAERKEAEEFMKAYKADAPQRQRVARTAGNAPEVAMELPPGYKTRVTSNPRKR